MIRKIEAKDHEQKANSNKKLQPKPKKASKLVKQKMFMEAYVRHMFNISSACAELGMSRKQAYQWLKEEKFSEEFRDCLEARKDQIEEALFCKIKEGDTASIIFSAKTLCKDRGYVEHERQRGPEPLPLEAIAIIDRVLANDLDPQSAGLELTKLGIPIPEALRLMIAKQEVTDPVDTSWNQEEVEAELDRRYKEQMERVEKEEAIWIPQRRAEIQEIKNELKDQDSFSPDFHKGTNGNSKGGDSTNAGNQ